MKLAILGVVTALVGVLVGVDGLLLTGGVWVVIGSLLWVFVTRRQDTPNRAPHMVGFVFMLVLGIASLAIGIAGIGFEDHGTWRILPLAMGAFALVIGPLGLLAGAGGAGRVAVAEQRGETVLDARVIVEAKRQTGSYVNEQPRIELDLLVEPEGAETYRMTRKVTVPHSALGDLRVGEGFAARVVPGDDKALEIDWDAPIRG